MYLSVVVYVGRKRQSVSVNRVSCRLNRRNEQLLVRIETGSIVRKFIQKYRKFTNEVKQEKQHQKKDKK